MTLRTALCEVLGIEHPIVQSGMGGVAGPDLVAEVSRAGALGILAGLNVPPDDLRAMIRRVRALTDRPFGVNLWLHPAVEAPPDPATIPEADVRGAQAVLNRFRERLGLASTTARPAPLPDFVRAGFEVVLQERVPVFSIGLGHPGPDRVRACHERGIKVMAMVATVEDARVLDAEGVDVVVAQGGEAGGHRSVWREPVSPDAAAVGTMALVPQVVDAVRAPVVAAGGIADGRGLVAALALGASGVLLGTRFVATRESAAPEFWKKSLLEREADITVLTRAFTGLWARGLANAFSREYDAARAPVLPPLLQRAAAQDIYQASVKAQTGEYYPMWAGASVGLIRDLPGAAEVVERIVGEAREAFRRVQETIR
jgi:nitronate monooxygenase